MRGGWRPERLCRPPDGFGSSHLVNDLALKGGMIDGTSTVGVAHILTRAYGIVARSAVSDLGPPIPAFQVMLGEAPYQFIGSMARYAGFLVYEGSPDDWFKIVRYGRTNG